MADEGKKEAARTFARLKAGDIKRNPGRLSKARTRNLDGTPVDYSTIKNDAVSKDVDPRSDYRKSRSLSDPDIPGFLVISGKEGLFSNCKFGKTKGAFGEASNNRSITTEERPVFIEKQGGFGDIRSRFEKASSLDDSLDPQPLGEFMNPLHKGNRKKLDANPKPVKATVPIPSSDYNDDVIKKKLESTLSAPMPASPKPSDPKPSAPKPSDPKPSNPKPSAPKHSSPKPSAPKPSSPKPSTPKPSTPKPSDPKPSDPMPSPPKPSPPKPSSPKPSDPKPSDPKPSSPKPSTPRPSTPKPSTPKPSDPKPILATKPPVLVKPVLSPKPALAAKPALAPKPKSNLASGSGKKESTMKVDGKESEALDQSVLAVIQQTCVCTGPIIDKFNKYKSKAVEMPHRPPPRRIVKPHQTALANSDNDLEQNVQIKENNIEEDTLTEDVTDTEEKRVPVPTKNMRSQSDPTPLDNYSLKTGSKFYLNDKQDSISEEEVQEDLDRDSTFYVKVEKEGGVIEEKEHNIDTEKSVAIEKRGSIKGDGSDDNGDDDGGDVVVGGDDGGGGGGGGDDDGGDVDGGSGNKDIGGDGICGDGSVGGNNDIIGVDIGGDGVGNNDSGGDDSGGGDGVVGGNTDIGTDIGGDGICGDGSVDGNNDIIGVDIGGVGGGNNDIGEDDGGAADGNSDDDDDDGWDSDEFEDDDMEFHDDTETGIASSDTPTDKETLVFPDAKSKKLYNIAHEILSTEKGYVKRLHLLDKVFYSRLDNECRAKGFISLEVLQDIFSNIGAIHTLHKDFLLPKLEERMNQWSTNNTIGDILKSLAPFLKLYAAYIANFDNANETLSVWMKRSTKFASIIEEIQKSRESENLTLQHHMLEPIQRVPRYKMLLSDYISKLPEDSPDLKNAQDALVIIAEAARHANDSMKKTERFKKLLEIQERLIEEFDLIAASREFVKEGDLIKVAARSQAGHQERTLLLFNDKLLCCSKFAGTNKLKVKVAMDIDGMGTGNAGEDVEMPNAFRITSKQRVIDFSAASEDDREQWMKALNDVISEFMRKRDSYKRSSRHEVMSDRELGTKAPAWIRDESVTMCMLCDAMFTLTRRRHHCRACGGIYCSHCCHCKVSLEYCGGKQMRVCQTCHKVLVKGFNEISVRRHVDQANSLDLRKLSTGNKVLLSGFLGYRGGSDKHWVRRWCAVSDNFVLYFYKGRKDTKAAFSLPLPGYVVDKPNLADDIDKKLSFKLHHKNVVVHFFATNDEVSLKRWMHHLSYAIKAEVAPDEDLAEDQEEKERASSV